MNSDEQILKALEDLKTGQRALQADVASVKDVQQEQGKQLTQQGTQLETLELKTEAIHAYQKQAHDEIMEHLIESNEINGQEQKALEKRIEVLEENAGIPHPDKN
jgi:chromosome segregation ATPase